MSRDRLIWVKDVGGWLLIDMSGRREIILEIGAEGGSIELFGVRSEHGWRFNTSIVDWTPELIGEERVQHESDVVQSWEAAVQLLDRCPWHALFPLHVYPEFREKIWTPAQKRAAQNAGSSPALERWQECRRPGGR